MARLELTLLGRFAARVGQHPLRLPGRKPRALLAYLTLRQGPAHPRDRLAALLWPEAAEGRARDSLRHVIGALRSALRPVRPAALLSERETVAVRPGAVAVDAVLFERLATVGSPATLARAAALYAGDLLDGFEAGEGPFGDWLAAERGRLRGLALTCLGALLAHYVRTKAAGAAIRTAARLLAFDPTDETAHRALMQLYAGQGWRGAALHQYQVCVSALERGLDTAPAPETRSLYHDLLRSAGHETGPPPRRPGSPARPAAAAPPLLPAHDPLVGRRSEVARLGEALAAARAGRGQILVLLGEAGVGKSRLVAALGQEAAGQPTHLLVGRSHETERILPFAPWVDLLRRGGVPGDRRLLEALGRPWRSELRRVLPEIERGTPPPGRDPTRLFEAVNRVVALLAARRPVAIVLEDLHWADDMSVRLFAFLGRRVAGSPVLLVGTVRDDETVGEPALGLVLDEIRREPHGTVLSLAPLGRADISALVRALARAGTPPARLDRIEAEIWRLSEGNPFVATETMRALEAAGIPEAPGQLSLPARVQDLVATRLSRLSAEARTLAEVAAVIGGVFDFDLLCRASGLDETRVAAGVEELVRARLLHGVEAELGLVHERSRQVVLDRLSPPRRSRLHRQVAEGLEAAGQARGEPDLDALAAHYRQGRVWSKAVEYLVRFAEQAASRYAIDDALAALRDARKLVGHLSAAEQDRRGLDVALRLAHGLCFLGRHDEASRLLEAEEDRLARTAEPALAGRYHFHRARCASLAGDHDGAEGHAQQALEHAERGGDTATLGQAHYLLAHEAYWTSRPAAGVEHAQRAIALLEGTDERWWLGHAWWILGVNFGILGQLGRMLDAAARTEAIGERLGDQRLRSYALWSRGWALAARGDPTAAIAACRRAVELAPDPVSLMNARQALGYAWLEAGRSDRAILELEPIVAELGRLGVMRPYGLFAAYLAEAHRARGAREEARETATRALEITRRLGYDYATGLALRTLGRLALDQAEPGAARARLAEARDTFAAIGARFEEARTRLDLSRAEQDLAPP